jgi:hypothetical protein
MAWLIFTVIVASLTVWRVYHWVLWTVTSRKKLEKRAMTFWGVNKSAMVSCLFRWFRVYKQRLKSKSIGNGSQRRSLVCVFEKGGVSLSGIISFGVAFCLLELLIYLCGFAVFKVCHGIAFLVFFGLRPVALHASMA